MNYPILDNREVIGHATSLEQARRILSKRIDITAGFRLYVWLRSDSICEILDLPKGYVFSVTKYF